MVGGIFEKKLAVLRNPWAWLLLVPLLTYSSFLIRFALNVPLGDDILDVLRTLTAVVAAPDLAAAFDSLYRQHNDHRTLSSRLIYLLVYVLRGEIDFRTLTFVANSGLLLLLYMFYRCLRDDRGGGLILLAAGFVLLQPRAYGITLWPMAAFAYHFVYVYALAAILCLHRTDPPRFLLALLFAALSTFSLASGQMLWLVGLASLLHQVRVRRLSLLYVFAWLAGAALILYLWRLGLQTPNTVPALLNHFWRTPLYHGAYSIALAGSAFSESSLPLALAGGILLITVVLFSLLRNWRRDDLRLEFYLGFVLLSILAMTLGRAPYADLNFTLAAYHAFPSVLLLTGVVVLFAARFLFSYRARLALAAAAVIYWALAWNIWPASLQAYYDIRIEEFNQGVYRSFGTPLRKSRAIVEQAVELGIYNPPERPLEKRIMEAPIPLL